MHCASVHEVSPWDLRFLEVSLAEMLGTTPFSCFSFKEQGSYSSLPLGTQITFQNHPDRPHHIHRGVISG